MQTKYKYKVGRRQIEVVIIDGVSNWINILNKKIWHGWFTHDGVWHNGGNGTSILGDLQLQPLTKEAKVIRDIIQLWIRNPLNMGLGHFIKSSL